MFDVCHVDRNFLKRIVAQQRHVNSSFRHGVANVVDNVDIAFVIYIQETNFEDKCFCRFREIKFDGTALYVVIRNAHIGISRFLNNKNIAERLAVCSQ